MAETFQDQATGLYVAAREHKRASAFHRRAAKRKMVALAELQDRARALGIKIIITTNGEGIKNHGQEKKSTP